MSGSYITIDGEVSNDIKRLYISFQDKHLNDAALRAASVKKQQSGSSSGNSTPSQPAGPAPPPPVYPEDAAMQAIRRFSCRVPFTEVGCHKDHRSTSVQ